MKRTPIYSLTEEHGPQVIEESYPGESLPSDVVYINRYTWKVVAGRTILDLPNDAIEVPKTTWYC
jgi:hypothetical protein